MIDIQQLTSLISAFRVETEKESISPETVGSILQAIADLLATATSETEYNIIRFWKEPGHRRPAGHRHQRDRVQHHPLLEGNAPAVPFPL